MNIMTNEEIASLIDFKYPEITIKDNDCEDGFYTELDMTPPPFHESLDACFKYIVPWLHEQGYKYVVTGDKLNTQVRILNHDRVFAGLGNDKSPSTAFIKALSAMVTTKQVK